LTGVTLQVTINVKLIKTFRHKGLKEQFETGTSKTVPADMRERIQRRLDVLDAARTISGVNVPGFNLHPLKGNRAGEWAITVTKNYRITFRFENGDALDVHLEDYHS
jgi:proteic killer suppression protein